MKTQKENKKIQIVLTGGEFFLYKDWRLLIDHLTRNGIPFDIATNGIALSEEIAIKLQESSIHNLQISLDGLSELDNSLRNPYFTNRVIRNICMIANTPLKKLITIKSTIIKINLKNAFQIVDFCHAHGLKLNFGFVQILGRAVNNINLAPSSEEIYEFNKTIINKYPDIPLPIMFSHTPCPLDIDEEPLSFRVTSNGDIYPCASFEEPFFIIGNAFSNEISSALDPIAVNELNKNIIDFCRDKILFMISHQLSTTLDADQIYYIESGKIREHGTHNELMEKKGSYADMFVAQSKNYKRPI